MGHQPRSDAQFLTHHASAISTSRPMSIPFIIPEQDPDDNLSWPFGKLDGLDGDDIREAAYEVFFTSCRSSPGFGGRHALAFYSSHESMDGIGFGTGSRPGSPGRVNGVGMLPNSRIKKALGLKTLKRIPSRRTSYGGTGSLPSSPSGLGRGSGSSPGVSFTVPARTMTRRPLTSAEIMRMHMRVTEESDSRLRKTLMRTFVGQMGRRVETIILPLELLRHLRQSEFNSGQEYNFWQRRQLKILEAGLVLHPSIVLDQHNILAMKLQDIVRACEAKTIDTSKYSETMRVLCDCVVSLAWRGPSGNPTTTCHWADGYPLNVHLYLALLRSIFDLRDETMVLEEVDELVELMKKTWSILGINRPLHNVCFTWVLFQQYVITGQTEPDLLSASFTMLTEVANDAKRFDRDAVHVKALASVLTSVIGWSEKRLLNYHEAFSKPHAGVLENLLPLVLQARKMLKEDVAATIAAKQEQGEVTPELSGPCGNRVDFYIRSSLKNAFKKMIETGNMSIMASDTDQASGETLIELAQATEELAAKERETYSNMLKRWHPVAAGVAALTLHNCYGAVVNQYIAGVCTLSGETINALQRAGKLEKILVQMVVEDSTNCEDGGKAIVREMIPYEVDSIIIRLLRKSIEETLRKPKDYVQRVKETETWNPKSKAEPFAQSAVELMKLAKETVDEFFELPIGISENLVKDLAGGLERIVRDYTTFVASCGTKQSYVPSLPPLTRCNRGSKFTLLWRKASCSIGAEELYQTLSVEDHHQHPSTSRGTQRLYIRLNTLHYIVSHLNSLDKTLCLSPRVVTLTHKHFPRSTLGNSSSYFELARASVQGAIHHVAEVAAYRLIFLDSNSEFYESLYVRDVASARIQPALRLLKQNLSLMGAILIDRAQPLAVKAVMKASFDAFLMVLLAGGGTRNFSMSDHAMIEEDAESLKHAFCLSRAGLIAEDEVEREAEIVEGVVALMGQTTEQLVEDFSIAARERSGTGIDGAGQKLPMPPTTAKWNRSDPNTILRILCHRNDKAANAFLKRTFQLPKRR